MKKLIWVAVVGVLVVGGWFAWKSLSKPLPGEAVAQLGQNHVNDISSVTYNSDPPTSGPHFPVWAKRGVYDRVISDGHLIHSMEHGYIVASYNCDKLKTQNSNVKSEEGEATPSAQATDSAKPLMMMKVGVTGNMSFFTPENVPEAEIQLPESFKSAECKKMVEGLWDTADDFQRVIIVPRPTLDTPIAITAWGKLLKLENLDTPVIKDFISVYHNAGPEKTQE